MNRVNLNDFFKTTIFDTEALVPYSDKTLDSVKPFSNITSEEAFGENGPKLDKLARMVPNYPGIVVTGGTALQYYLKALPRERQKQVQDDCSSKERFNIIEDPCSTLNLTIQKNTNAGVEPFINEGLFHLLTPSLISLYERGNYSPVITVNFGRRIRETFARITCIQNSLIIKEGVQSFLKDITDAEYFKSFGYTKEWVNLEGMRIKLQKDGFSSLNYQNYFDERKEVSLGDKNFELDELGHIIGKLLLQIRYNGMLNNYNLSTLSLATALGRQYFHEEYSPEDQLKTFNTRFVGKDNPYGFVPEDLRHNCMEEPRRMFDAFSNNERYRRLYGLKESLFDLNPIDIRTSYQFRRLWPKVFKPIVNTHNKVVGAKTRGEDFYI